MKLLGAGSLDEITRIDFGAMSSHATEQLGYAINEFFKERNGLSSYSGTIDSSMETVQGIHGDGFLTDCSPVNSDVYLRAAAQFKGSSPRFLNLLDEIAKDESLMRFSAQQENGQNVEITLLSEKMQEKIGIPHDSVAMILAKGKSKTIITLSKSVLKDKEGKMVPASVYMDADETVNKSVQKMFDDYGKNIQRSMKALEDKQQSKFTVEALMKRIAKKNPDLGIKNAQTLATAVKTASESIAKAYAARWRVLDGVSVTKARSIARALENYDKVLKANVAKVSPKYAGIIQKKQYEFTIMEILKKIEAKNPNLGLRDARVLADAVSNANKCIAKAYAERQQELDGMSIRRARNIVKAMNTYDKAVGTNIGKVAPEYASLVQKLR